MLRSSAAHITAVLTLCDILVHCYVPMAPRQATISSLSAGTTTANALQNCPTDPPYVRFATFGDSYASGVTYGSGCVSGHCDGRPDRDYDYGDAEMIRQCRRIIDAYAYQTKNDCSWSNGASPYLDWPACSGSRFGAISDDGGQASTLFNSQQSAGSANISNFATLQIGGNDAGFFDVVSTCFFQPSQDCNYDYGPAYPDPSGECWSAVQNALRNINNTLFQEGYTKAFTAILNHPAVRDKADFRLFVLGYAELFMINDGGNGDACDQLSWTAYCQDFTTGNPADWSRWHRYNVTTPLRQDVNDIILFLNNAITLAVSSWIATNNDDQRIVYVDINEAFENQRFCQIPSGGSISNGWEESWFWRGPLLSDFLADDSTVPYNTTNSTAAVPTWNSSSELDPLTVAGCSSLDSSNTQPWDVQLSCQLQAIGQPVASEPIGPISDWSGPGGGGLVDRGEVLRTFHPTADGHKAIYKVLVEAITEEQAKSPFINPS